MDVGFVVDQENFNRRVNAKWRDSAYLKKPLHLADNLSQ